MKVYAEILNYFDDSEYKKEYESLIAEINEDLASYDQAIKNIAKAVKEQGGDLDDAIAMWDDMIHNLQSVLD